MPSPGIQMKTFTPVVPKSLSSLSTMAAANNHVALPTSSESKTNVSSPTLKKMTSALNSLSDSIMNAKSTISKGLATIAGALSISPEGMDKLAESATMLPGVVVGTVKMATEVSEMAGPALETVGYAMDKTLEALDVGTSALGAALGIVTIMKGVDSLCSSFCSYQRSEGLNDASGELDILQAQSPVESKEDKEAPEGGMDQLNDDLKFCADSNKTKSKDLALSGAMDVVVGGSSLAVAVITHGLSTFVTPLVGWIASAALKAGVQEMRGREASSSDGPKKEDVHERLSSRLDTLKSSEPGQPLSTKDKAMLVALKSVRLLPQNLDITKPLSPENHQKLQNISHEDIGEKFTNGTKTMNLQVDSGIKYAINLVKTFSE
jgi:hypothetical protein